MPMLCKNVSAHAQIGHYQLYQHAERKWCGCIGHTLLNASSLWSEIRDIIKLCKNAIASDRSRFVSSCAPHNDWFEANFEHLLECHSEPDRDSLMFGTMFGILLNSFMKIPIYMVHNDHANSLSSLVPAGVHITPTTIVCGYTAGKWYPFKDTSFPCSPLAVCANWFRSSRFMLTIRHHQDMDTEALQLLVGEVGEARALICINAARALNLDDPSSWVLSAQSMNRQLWLVTNQPHAGVGHPSLVGVGPCGTFTTRISIDDWQNHYSAKVTARDIVFVAAASRSNPAHIMINKVTTPVIDDHIGVERKDKKLGTAIRACMRCVM